MKKFRSCLAAALAAALIYSAPAGAVSLYSGVSAKPVALPVLPASETPTTNPLAPRAPHFAPKAKRVILLFMAGAPSNLELFDNKPQLAKFDGTLPPPELSQQRALAARLA